MVIDANRHLQVALASSDLNYVAVGMPSSKRDK